MTHTVKDYIVSNHKKQYLIRKLRFDVLLETPEKEGPENFVETSNDEHRFFLTEFDTLTRAGERTIEPGKHLDYNEEESCVTAHSFASMRQDMSSSRVCITI